MKTLKTVFLIFLSLVLFVNSIQAQTHDYVITVPGDTLKGQFIGKKFKADSWPNARELDLAGYKETYRAATHDLERAVFFPKDSLILFLPVIIDGKITLYELDGSTMDVGQHGVAAVHKTIELFVTKGNSQVKELNYTGHGAAFFESKKKRMDTLGQLLMDNKNVYNKFIADDKFTGRAIKNIINLYDNGQPLGLDVTGDYVIKNNKDTIFCEIEPATVTSMAKYRVNETDKYIKIDTSITEYFLSDNYADYFLKTLPRNNYRQHVKLLLKGRISLYSYSLSSSVEDSDAALFISKDNEALVQIKHEFSRPDRYEKKAFTDLASDDLKLAQKLKDFPFDYKSIYDYLVMYNSDHPNDGQPGN